MSFQAYLDTVKGKTGLSPEDFRLLAEQRGLLQPGVKAGAIKAWLKAEYGLGPGHAMAIYGVIKPATEPELTLDEHVGKHFSGRRAGWKAPYEQLMAAVEQFGAGITVQPTSAYISLLHDGGKFAIVKVAAERLDVGIKLKGVEAGERLQPAGAWNTMVTHRVGIEDPKQLDAELLGWLRLAYDRA